MNKFVFLLLMLLSYFTQAQNYFKGKYVFPIKPDSGKIVLTGNVGEIRPNHFHCGLDVAEKEGEPIYSIYQGYVSRIKVSSYGYGNVVYITHPETEHVSVYAHLSDFSPSLRRYIRQKQYEQESFEVEIFPSPDELPIQTKEIIGYLGNTGGSFGPHLHFEIRTIADFVLNAQYFYDIQKDNLPPKLFQIALSPLSTESQIEGKYEVWRVSPKDMKTHWEIPKAVQAYGWIGLEGITWDMAEKAANTYATVKARLRVNNKEIFSFHIQNFPMYEVAGMNLHINYPLLQKTGSNFQRFYQVDGNRLGIYEGNGKIWIEDGKSYAIELDLEDANGNAKTLKMTIEGKKKNTERLASKLITSGFLQYEIVDKTLIIKAKYSKEAVGNIALIFSDKVKEIPMAYLKNKEAVFLYDLGKGLPQKIKSANNELFIKKKIINADCNFTYEDNFMKVFFPDGALADTSYLDFSSKTSHFFIGNVSEPLVWDAHISYKYPKNSILHLDKAYLQGKGKSYIFSEKNDSIFRVQVDRLGDFKILKDEVPPFIKLIRKSPAKLVFQISDIGSGIKSFKGYLNGKFVLMEYEYKNSLLWTDPLFTETFIGDFELIVEDKVGNLKHYKLSL